MIYIVPDPGVGHPRVRFAWICAFAHVVAANRSIGHHWFERSTMRFFKTRIESGLIAGHRFISSERGPDEVRRYTVREACPDGTIDTVGEFQQYRTRDQARAAVLAG